MNYKHYQNEEARTERILRLSMVITKTGLSKTTLYERIKQGLFPAPISLGGRSVGWLESEINEWIVQCRQQTRQHESCMDSNS